ncbi:hypothetical protein B0O80DRAFT_168843 [Mortierella sp. GBAus27b]|nr:hypothetical protein B0O80DRAFT_168843 [Mortierella sp. GBAus27b]
MTGLTGSSGSSRGAYISLNQDQNKTQELQDNPQSLAHGQSFPLQDKSNHSSSSQDRIEEDFRVSLVDNDHGGDDDEDEDLEELDDLAPLANSKRHSSRSGSSSSRITHPCKVLGIIFCAAVVISLAFATLSLLHINTNNTLHHDLDNPAALKPPPGTSADDFKLSDFQIPPWDWDLNSYLPIDITNGPKFTSVVWKDEAQYLAVDCPHQAHYQYHFPSFTKDEFREYPTESQLADDLLPLGQEPYVFVICPPGNNNANLVFRELEKPKDSTPTAPPHVDSTMEAPQPLLDDVVLILVDAISRAKFIAEMKTVMGTLASINSTTEDNKRHRIFDFQHYNVLGQNSPPNKVALYSGQLYSNLRGPKHWLWDVYEEQGFTTAHTDGECGGEQGIRDFMSGAITSEYARTTKRLPAQYQMPETAWCQNHDMHVSGVWGQSCMLPHRLNYDKTLMGGMRWNTPYCAGEKAIHEHIMESLEGWLSSSKGQRRFATYSFMDTHTPDHHHISFDRRMATLVQRLLVGQDGQPPLLSPYSALVIMADHGLHYGRETYTFPGFIHHKIPPLLVALPNQLLDSHPDFVVALEQNQNRILSHLDLHQTFIHLAYGDMPVEGEGVNDYSDFMTKFIADGNFRQQFHAGAPNDTSYAQIYGRSLLLPIEESRSCRTGGIPHDYCAFQPFLNLDPTKTQDIVFMQGALIMLANRMNNLTVIYHVDDVCRPSSLVLQPGVNGATPSTFEDIGTEDLVLESAFATSIPSRAPKQQNDPNLDDGSMEDSRVFYFMVRDRARTSRKYSVTMREDEIVEGRSDSMTITQMTEYAAGWSHCLRRIQAGGKAVGDKWSDIMKHFCVCS